MTEPSSPHLKRSLKTIHLWGIAVGLVITGEYFGWSYGWDKAGTLGFLASTMAVALMYTAFIFSYTELTTSIPHAGGPFADSRRAFGTGGGCLAGKATLIEFVFAPPAIALAIGAYLKVQFPALDPKQVAVGAYLVFMFINVIGVGIAAIFELLVTLLAIGELLVFMGVVAPAFAWSNFAARAWAEQALAAMTYFNPQLFGLFAAFMALGYLYFVLTARQRAGAPAHALLDNPAA